MAGTIFIILGIILLMLGITLLIKSKDKVIQKVKTESETKELELDNLVKLAVADGVLTDNEKEIIFTKASELNIKPEIIEKKLSKELQNNINPETKLIDKEKEKGDLFEAYTARKFDKKYFTLKGWAGDKYTNGIYAETTTQPDLKLCFKLRDIKHNFAIECKYRSNYFNNGIEWAKQSQFNNYRKFEKDEQMPVFVVIGVGGSADNPNELFIIPLCEIKDIFLHNSFMSKYKKHNFKTNNLYFDYNTKKLK
ncbi:hypothetical protein QUF75_15250 [Desulfococcaceae bacterium HSG7]|nr:hypothetical protein [Desulfococcaceae bacterium HSG7]